MNLQVDLKKKLSANKLPFLQAQILQKIYFDIEHQVITNINEIADITDYQPDSKILLDAIKTLVSKNFLLGDLLSGFSVPTYRKNLYLNIVNKKNYSVRKIYSNRLLKIFQTNSVSDLFENDDSISQLNSNGCIHKWYNYLEEFPYSLIEQKIVEYKLAKDALIVEPFSGSGTTLVSANLFGCDAVGFDSNPLMTFISKVKTTWNIDLDLFKYYAVLITENFIEHISLAFEESSYEALKLDRGFLKCMPKKELNQWLHPVLQREVIVLKNIIDKIENEDIKNCFLLALSKSTFDASYVSLCPGTTFYPFKEKEEFFTLFTEKILQIYNDLSLVQKHNIKSKSNLINDTCLSANKYFKPSSIDFIITSPPYPNDLEYTRQTRLELYLLDFVKNMDDIQKIKRTMVKGSTKLIFKESDSEKYIKNIKSIAYVSDKIYEQTKDKNWGFDYPRMVREYFGDMYLCMKNFYELLKPEAYFLLVVGDQTIKGVYIPVCEILIELAELIGYKNCKKELFRMRRSTGHSIELPEEIVILQR